MYMQQFALKSNEVRDHFSETIDDIVRTSPKLMVRRRDKVFMMNDDHLSTILGQYDLNVSLERDDETDEWIATLNEIEDLFASNEDPELAVMQVIEFLVEYAHDYMNDFNMYFMAPNRRAHFPLVMKVMMLSNHEEVRNILNVKY